MPGVSSRVEFIGRTFVESPQKKHRRVEERHRDPRFDCQLHCLISYITSPDQSQRVQDSNIEMKATFASMNVSRFGRAHRRPRVALDRFSYAQLAVALLALLSSCRSGADAFAVEKQNNINSIKRIVFGTAALSKAADPLMVLDSAYVKGFRRFDLAHTYGGGESERIFGEWLVSRGINRDTVDIITKGGIGDDKYGDPDRPLLTRETLRSEIQDSFDALKTDWVDLYMFHRDDPRLPVENFVMWINDEMKEGRIKSWGVSNWSFDRFRDAFAFAKRHNLVPPTANSPQFSLAVPLCEVWPSTETISAPDYSYQIDWYEANDVELVCWEVLAKGFMAKEDLWPEDEVCEPSLECPVERGSDQWRVQRIQRAYCHSENYRRRNLATMLARKFGGKLAQIAMLYPLARGKHISVIFGASKDGHLDDMAALQHLNIDSEAMELLSGTKNVRDVRHTGFPFVPQMVAGGLNNIKPSNFKRQASRFSVPTMGAEY